MKIIKLSTAVLALIFAIISFTNLIDDRISMPVMLSFLAISQIIIAYETYKSGKKSMSLFMAAVALFIFITIGIVIFM